jgi:hypothetical protein
MISNGVIFILQSYMQSWYIQDKSNNKVNTNVLVFLGWILNLCFLIVIASIDTGKMNMILHIITAMVFFLGGIPYMLLNNYLLKKCPYIKNKLGLRCK